MPTNPNMVAIQTVTVGAGGAASIDFTSIPQTYTDLCVLLSYRAAVAGPTDGNISFNSSTANFSWKSVLGTGSSAVSSNNTTNNALGQVQGANATASTFANVQIYIPNYAGSTNKSFSVDYVTENNATLAYAGLVAGLWSNSAAITSVGISLASGNLVEHSTATLYGVTSAGYGAKATGGIITQDNNYFYHTFLASGTFTPTSSYSADVLVIAGGGSGGYSYGGGGGAGGLCYQTGRSLTSSTAYTVTVGAGAASKTTGGQGNDGSNSVFDTITANGGGGGGGFTSNPANADLNGRAGGSGGGAAANNAVSGTVGATNQGTSGGATGYGFAGGLGSVSYKGGGGGGAGEAGNTDGGASGGDGLNTWSTWANVTGTGVNGFYAGGGGGARSLADGGKWPGGEGGGGAGADDQGATRSGTAGTVNTGGGGGGFYDTAGSSGAGGSGIVIVRYAK
jgi:hypothetical protein